MLAVDFGGTKVDLAVVGSGPDREVLARRRLATDADNGADQVVERALAAAHELVATIAPDASVVLSAVGVATMGYTHEDRVELAPNVPGWEKLRLPARLRESFPGTPIVLDNDVRAAALAELRWGALRGGSNAVYLNLGTGVAATLVIDGRILDGAHGVAGEVGYWLVPAAGGWSTLEAEIGGAGVQRRARKAGSEGGLAELMAASSREPAAASLVDDVLAQIAVNVLNIALLVDPEVIVLGGGYVGAGERLLSEIRQSLDTHGLFPIEVVVGAFGRDAGLHGAIALAEQASGPAGIA